MFVLGNVKKFLQDNKSKIDLQKRRDIFARAKNMANPEGIILAGMNDDLWQNAELAERFMRTITTDRAHLKIGLTVLRMQSG